MSFVFPILGAGPIGPLLSAERPPRPAAEPPDAGAASPTPSKGGPPPEVRAEVQEAARCADRLREQGRQLRFEPDPESGRIRVEVLDKDGRLLRRLPLTELLDVVRGKRLD